jgi:hypothetical protein
MIDENLGGKSDRKRIQKTKCVNALSKISEILKTHMDVIQENEKLVRLIAQSFKVAGEETQDPSLIQRAIEIIKRILGTMK